MSRAWECVKLKDVCRLDKRQGHYKALPYVGLEDIEANTGRFAGSLSPREVKSSTFRFAENHILYGRLRPYLNKVCIADFEGHCSTEIFPIAVNDRVLSRYLLHWLMKKSTVRAIDGTSTGTRMPRAQMNEVMEFELPLPPMAEQRRIVAFLDQAFEAIDVAKANSEKSELSVKGLFARVLHESLDRLRRESTIVNVAELVRQGVLEKPQDGNHGESHPTRAEYLPQGVPFVMAADLQAGGVNTVMCRFISKTRANNLRIGFAMNGDVLLSHKGTIGRVAVLKTDLDYVMLTPQVTYYRVLDRTRILNRYLYFYFQSEQFQVALAKIAGAGSTRAYIGITRQLDLEVLVPPLLKQAELVERLTKLEPVCAALSDNYRKKLQQTELLRQALLTATFEGNSREAA